MKTPINYTANKLEELINLIKSSESKAINIFNDIYNDLISDDKEKNFKSILVKIETYFNDFPSARIGYLNKDHKRIFGITDAELAARKKFYEDVSKFFNRAIEKGDTVRSFDFFIKDITGKHACYVEGVVNNITTPKFMPGNCKFYEIKVSKKMFGGEEVEFDKNEFIYAPVNGTPKMMGDVCDAVELV